MSERPPGENDPCPCGSGHGFAACCGACLAGQPAPTAERLMRSRYCAYVLGDTDYLLRTWHHSERPRSVDLAEGPEWLGLDIRHTEAGEATDDEGYVEFVARFRAAGRSGGLHETSRFVREAGQWYYVDGRIHPAAEKVGRNAPCPCGSGRKFKRCCGR